MPIAYTAIIRYGAILIISFGLAYFLPISTNPAATIALVPTIVIFSLLGAFLINRAIDRKRMLSSSIALELSRLRRMNHLAEGMDDAAWKKLLRKAVTAYQMKLGDNFRSYADSSSAFRTLTHLVYRYEPKNRYEELIIQDLLHTTRDLALERQHIEQGLERHLSWYSWVIIVTLAIFAAMLFLKTRTIAPWAAENAGIGIASVLLILDLLKHVDMLSSKEITAFERMYQKNITKNRE